MVKLMICCIVVLSAAACATTQQKEPPLPRQKDMQRQPRQVDAKAQQQFYDQGLKLYSREKYREAKKAFQQAVQNGPRTSLGVKSQENIRKIDQILKTLEELESP